MNFETRLAKISVTKKIIFTPKWQNVNYPKRSLTFSQISNFLLFHILEKRLHWNAFQNKSCRNKILHYEVSLRFVRRIDLLPTASGKVVGR